MMADIPNDPDQEKEEEEYKKGRILHYDEEDDTEDDPKPDDDFWEPIALGHGAIYNQADRCLEVPPDVVKNKDSLREVYETLWTRRQIVVRVFRATWMFRYCRVANLQSGGRHGSKFAKGQAKFLHIIAEDTKKITNRDGMQRFKVKEKLFVRFTGYIVDPETKLITMVGAVVRIVEPFPGKNRHGFLEDKMEGPSIEAVRWADLDDLLKDFNMTVRLVKYFRAYEVDKELWGRQYNNTWHHDEVETKPHDAVRWSVGEHY